MNEKAAHRRAEPRQHTRKAAPPERRGERERAHLPYEPSDDATPTREYSSIPTRVVGLDARWLDAQAMADLTPASGERITERITEQQADDAPTLVMACKEQEQLPTCPFTPEPRGVRGLCVHPTLGAAVSVVGSEYGTVDAPPAKAKPPKNPALAKRLPLGAARLVPLQRSPGLRVAAVRRAGAGETRFSAVLRFIRSRMTRANSTSTGRPRPLLRRLVFVLLGCLLVGFLLGSVMRKVASSPAWQQSAEKQRAAAQRQVGMQPQKAEASVAVLSAEPSPPERPQELERAATAVEAVEHLAAGRLAEARASYEKLALTHPKQPAFAAIARTLAESAAACTAGEERKDCHVHIAR
jgi:hypothetical protein